MLAGDMIIRIPCRSVKATDCALQPSTRCMLLCFCASPGVAHNASNGVDAVECDGDVDDREYAVKSE